MFCGQCRREISTYKYQYAQHDHVLQRSKPHCPCPTRKSNMSSSDRRNAEANYVRSLPNFLEIRAATAPELHIHGRGLRRFDNKNIVLTPINMDPPPSYMMLSRYDYVQEHPKLRSGGASWDDTSANKAQIGDLFSFVFYQPARRVDRMEIFEIVDILSPEYRRSNWVIAEHANRRVLRLSKYLGRTRYSAFAAAKGYKHINNEHYGFVRGTVRTTWPVNVDVEMQGDVQHAGEEE